MKVKYKHMEAILDKNNLLLTLTLVITIGVAALLAGICYERNSSKEHFDIDVGGLHIEGYQQRKE